MSLGREGDDRPYYFRQRGRGLGPYSLQEMRQKAATAQVNGRTDVSRDGLDWKKGSDYPEIFVPERSRERDPGRGQWYYALGGAQQGPIDLATLQQYVASGTIQPSDVVFREGMTDWAPAQSVPELAMFVRRLHGQDPPVAVDSKPIQSPQVFQQAQSNGMAIAGFVCSLLGCVTCIPAILGLVFSLIALSGTNQANRGLAIAGAIISGIWLLLWVAYIVFTVLVAMANAFLTI